MIDLGMTRRDFEAIRHGRESVYTLRVFWHIYEVCVSRRSHIRARRSPGLSPYRTCAS
jgi:hypothetical protein